MSIENVNENETVPLNQWRVLDSFRASLREALMDRGCFAAFAFQPYLSRLALVKSQKLSNA
jgi:hypothetical protein